MNQKQTAAVKAKLAKLEGLWKKNLLPVGEYLARAEALEAKLAA